MSLKKLILELFFPKNCYGCNKSNTWLCDTCFNKIKKYQGEIPRALDSHSNLIIASEYKDPVLQRIIHDFKFGFNQDLVTALFVLVKEVLDQKILINSLSGKTWTNVIVVPLPLDRARKKWRGFNQSEVLAQKISQHYSWPLRKNLLKIKKTKIQNELNEEERKINQLGVFKWQGEKLDGLSVLLVDDIITSGATINEAEKILKEAGALKVIKVAVAKG